MKSNEQNVGISFVCQSLGNGGAERVVSILINYFYQKKYNVQLVLLYENTIDYYIPENISVIFLNWADKKNPLKFLPRLKQLRNTIKGRLKSGIRERAVSRFALTQNSRPASSSGVIWLIRSFTRVSVSRRQSS